MSQQIGVKVEEVSTLSLGTHKQGLVQLPSIQAVGGGALCMVFTRYFQLSGL